MKEYHHLPANRQDITNGWLHTGDWETDDEGSSRLQAARRPLIFGRREHLSAELEEALAQHPKVKAAVIGVKDKKFEARRRRS
jgi:acyl-CoA synthetase (AMP-forming)/AMP-acid ligase II